jgi:putative tryptophan/tyrosine transport system substrate-binding protein
VSSDKRSETKQSHKKIMVLTLCAILLALCASAAAQQAKKIPRIGYVSSGDPSSEPRLAAFRRGLQDLGYIEGKNIQVEYRYVEGKPEQVERLVTELVQLKVDVLVVGYLPAIHAAKRVTKTIPIVMVTPVDPVTNGIVDSLARPGGNITGLTRLTRDLKKQRLELLKEVVPRLSRVGILWNAGNENASLAFKEYETAARALNIPLPLQSLALRGPHPEFEGAFQAAAKERVSGLITIRDALFNRYRKRIADRAIKNRQPSIYEGSEYVEDGGLMSYAASDAESYRRAATYVDKILKGAKPADLPVEQPAKFELVINLKAAKQIGLTIPPKVLARADKVFK